MILEAAAAVVVKKTEHQALAKISYKTNCKQRNSQGGRFPWDLL